MKQMQPIIDYAFVEHMAITLEPEQVCEAHSSQLGMHSRTHDDGWTIHGAIHEDYIMWVNDFEAEHPIFGKVRGNFESQVWADSQEGFEHFYKNHTPHIWDYDDI